ncbi:MAG: hypothetical protein AAF591_14190 [Verrucomicrobiota bacterium]
MGRARNKADVEVSLFPFLSILACIIGCLTMIIVALSIIQANKDGREPEDVTRAKEFLKVEREQEDEGKKIDQLKQRIDAIILKREKLAEKREELKMLEIEVVEAEDVDQLRDELIAELNRLQQQIEQLVKDEEELMAQIELLKQEIADRELPPDEPAVLVRPSGSGINVRPFFVEVTNAAVILHQSLSEEPVRIPIAGINSDERFLELVNTAKATPNGQIVFLIRGDARGAYNRAQAIANAADVRNSKLPLVGQGKVDLRIFEEFLESPE